MAMTETERRAADARAKKKSEENEDLLERAKFDPVLTSREKSSEEVKSLGGLGAIAAAAKKKKEEDEKKKKLGGLGSGS